MLRCSNATAFRAQFTANMALKAVPRSWPWTRAPQRLLPLAYGTPAIIPPVCAARNIAATIRSYYDNRGPQKELESAPEPEPEHEPEPETEPETEPQPEEGAAVPPSIRIPRGRKGRHDNVDEDFLMRVAQNKGPEVNKKVVMMELHWLQDRVLLAERVRKLLGKSDFTLAVALVRAAQSKGMHTSAAWNSVFDYCLKKGSAKAAFRFWNEMKKRGTMPNHWGYTTMLGGLSKVTKTRGVDPVRIAQSIYQSLDNSNNPEKRTLIHTNAMLTVCAYHEAMDVLWEVAASLPEEGPGSPDAITYTIILNAVRRSIQVEAAKFRHYEAEKSHHKRLEGIAEAKRMWVDVVYRWKNGQLAMSNKLVSSMAGVLLEGTGDRHLYEVLQLLHQTTGIPILAKEPPRNSTVASRRAYSQKGTPRPAQPEESEDGVPFVDDTGRTFTDTELESGSEHSEDTQKVEENFDTVFDPVVPADVQPYTSPSDDSPHAGAHYMPVGNRELSVIMETCLQMTNASQAGKVYWKHLTQDDHGYRIFPDTRSFMGYLRIIRLAHSSRLAVEVMRDQMLPAGVEDGTPFHLALTACRRDNKNLNVLKNANELLKMMDSALLLPDYRVVGSYLDLVKILEDNPQSLISLNGLGTSGQSPSGKLETVGRGLLLELQKVAVENLRPIVAKLDEAMAGIWESRPDKSGTHGVDILTLKRQGQPAGKVLAVLSRARLFLDAILTGENKRKLSKETRKELQEQSTALRKYSSAEATQFFRNKTLYPTVAQQQAYAACKKAKLDDDKPAEATRE
ncbi:hypothetical protein BDW62DRAFT_184167 [Aspergillus aurantiobrunneus]